MSKEVTAHHPDEMAERIDLLGGWYIKRREFDRETMDLYSPGDFMAATFHHPKKARSFAAAITSKAAAPGVDLPVILEASDTRTGFALTLRWSDGAETLEFVSNHAAELLGYDLSGPDEAALAPPTAAVPNTDPALADVTSDFQEAWSTLNAWPQTGDIESGKVTDKGSIRIDSALAAMKESFDALLRRLAARPAPPEYTDPATAYSRRITIPYANWRGEFAEREIAPIRLFWGSNEWHPEPQWLIEAWDIKKSAIRTFALKGIAARPAPVGAVEVHSLDRLWDELSKRGGLISETDPTGAVCVEKDDLRGALAALSAARQAGEIQGSTIGRHLRSLMLEHPEKVEQARANPIMQGWFTGQIMRLTGGKARPDFVREIVSFALEAPNPGSADTTREGEIR